jgi:hypothetical protein
MAKVLGILVIVLGVWIGMEIFTKGTDEAFGGLFAAGGAREAGTAAEPPVQRIRSRVERDMAAGLARSEPGSVDESDPDEE